MSYPPVNPGPSYGPSASPSAGPAYSPSSAAPAQPSQMPYAPAAGTDTTSGWATAPASPAPAGATGFISTPPAPRRRLGPWIAAGAVLAVLALAAVGYGAWDLLKPDPGIAACEAMAGKRGPLGDANSDGNDKLSESEYLKLREVFADSKHADIRAAGTKLVDVLWQVSQIPEGQELGAIAYVGQVTGAMTELTGACANHGIVVKIPQG